MRPNELRCRAEKLLLSMLVQWQVTFCKKCQSHRSFLGVIEFLQKLEIAYQLKPRIKSEIPVYLQVCDCLSYLQL
jgi:hypothetical protein